MPCSARRRRSGPAGIGPTGRSGRRKGRGPREVAGPRRDLGSLRSMDTLAAARLQMALSLAFHMIFAAIGIGLPLLMVLVEGMWLRTGRDHYTDLAKKWAMATGIFFAVGAVSGTALSFELGLLWPRYIELTGAVV